MKKNIINMLGVFLCFISFTSCEDFLEKAPDNRATITDVESIAELLVCAYPESNYIPFIELMTDNVGDGGKLAVSIRKYEQAFKFEDITDVGQDTPTLYWNSCYKAIMQANMALDEIYKRCGKDITKEYENVYGEALLCRAYAHFMLVNLFAKPYNPATANEELGIPWVTEPEKVLIKEYKRENLETTYRNIVKDFEEGIKYVSNDSYSVPQYHFTKDAANAFGTRLYIILGEWQKVINCAKDIYGNNLSDNFRKWTSDYTALSEDQLKSFYCSSTEKANLLLKATVSPWSRYGDITRFGLTKTIARDMFSAKNVCKGDFGYTTLGYVSIERAYVPKYVESFRAEGMNAESGWLYTTIPLFSVEEVMFNLCEALTMQDKFEEVRTNLDNFFSKRIRDYSIEENKVEEERILFVDEDDLTDPKPFYNISEAQKVYIKCILRLKRMEYINEGLRFFDLRRYNLPVSHINADGTEYNLSIDDNRKTFQIPVSAVQFGLTPNKR